VIAARVARGLACAIPSIAPIKAMLVIFIVGGCRAFGKMFR
jgi:hypothetical protein